MGSEEKKIKRSKGTNEPPSPGDDRRMTIMACGSESPAKTKELFSL